MSDVVNMSALELAARIREREVSPVEVVQAVLDRVSKVDPLVHAMVTVDADGALLAARRAESILLQEHHSVGPLHGVPITVKDLVATQGMRTTMGSRLLVDNIPDADAPAITLLRDAGAIIIGKTATPEFGHKAVTDGLLGEPTANPWNLELTAGGSSGGAAAAVAAGVAPIAVGTDGGGSIRVPAALCGVVGLKATAGSVPTYPPSRIGALGHTGPLARTVADTALALAVMQGAGQHVSEMVRRVTESANSLTGLRIGVFSDVNGLPVEPDLLLAVDQAATSAETLGALVERTAIPCAGFEEIWDILFDGGMLSQAEQFPSDAGALYSPSFAVVLANAMRRSRGEAQRADARRIELSYRVGRLFARHDVLLGPTVSVPAFPLGIDGPTTIAGASVDERSWWRLTQIWNLCGQPACSLPYGITETGLPVGVQIIGAVGQDETVLTVAAALESAFEGLSAATALTGL